MNMTLNQLMYEEGASLTKISKKTGLSISLLSKIMNDKAPITDNVKEKIKSVYPNCDLVNYAFDYRKAYFELKEQFEYYKILTYSIVEDYEKLVQDLEKIKTICYVPKMPFTSKYISRQKNKLKEY